MHIIHIASELAPVAKVGGLADVTLGLCRELSNQGHDVDIIIPKYDCMNVDLIRDLTIEHLDLMSFYKGEWYSNTVWVGWVENLKVYFIDPHHPKFFFNRSCYYGCDDDIERFLYFSRATMEFLYKKSLRPDIIHIHDWQTAVIGPLFKDTYQSLGFQKTKLVFTIHNLNYQGLCKPTDLDGIGINGMSYYKPNLLQDLTHPDCINLLKSGLLYSDFITTVSPNYAQEILTHEGGRGLESTLKEIQHKCVGILNGIDYSYWNPETDPFLPMHYSSREMPTDKKDHNTIDKKSYIKNVLREQLHLTEDHRPIIGCITRLIPQKGIELIKHVIRHIVEKKGQFILLGSSPIPSISEEFHQMKNEFKDHPHIHLALNHEESLAHHIFAASDMFIVPSIFEPCGLTQMIALRYGSIPIVRRTGGLADSINDIDYSKKLFEERNGYVFDHPDVKGVDSALDRAMGCWFKEPKKWRSLMINGMNYDFSWKKPAQLYINIYKKLFTNTQL